MNTKPNILLIACDQLVPFLTGAYGHHVVKTPNLDKLVAEGIRYDCAYSPCPICVPARAAMMTGKYANNNKVYDNASILPVFEPTIAHYLTIAGYDTVASGKLHYIGPDQLHGFHRRLTTDIFPSDLNFLPDKSMRDGADTFSDVHVNPIAIDYVTAGVRQWSMGFEFDAETQFRALEYIRSRRMQVGGTLQKPPKERDPRPFFLHVSYTHPHEPFHVTQELWDLYEDASIEIPQFSENMAEKYSEMDRWLNMYHGVEEVDLQNTANLYNLRRAYYGLVTDIDAKIGELIKALEDCGLRENTVIIFVSDHGDMLGEKGMVQKRTFYEWSSRVPIIISFPDKRYAGAKVNTPASLVDILPTVLDIAGIAAEHRLAYDGCSLIELIDRGVMERYVFSENHVDGVAAPCYMVRNSRFKLVYVHGYSIQLFDMEEDPDESHNLAGKSEYSVIEKKLMEELLHRFDPEAVEKEIRETYPKRLLVKKAMKINGTKWDYQPIFDASKQYWREG